MKRWLLLFMIIIFATVAVVLGQTALDPDDFAGEWYSASEQTIYLFQDGMIYCQKHAIPLSDTESISGAYVYSKDTIALFADGIDGLGTVQELYLVENRDECLLCDQKDGSGRIYFVRANKR